MRFAVHEPTTMSFDRLAGLLRDTQLDRTRLHDAVSHLLSFINVDDSMFFLSALPIYANGYADV
jgi:hypothetical protein